MSVARDDDAQGDPRVPSPRDARATWSDPRPRAFLESPKRDPLDHTRHHAHAQPRAPYTPPREASALSVAAAAGSALAALGKQVLARGRCPGCEVDLVAVRAETPLDFRRCLVARAEHANLVSRAKHTPRAVAAEDVLDALDGRDDVTHIYVTYDHPESRHTLGVARVAAPTLRRDGEEARFPSFSNGAPNSARPGGVFQRTCLSSDRARPSFSFPSSLEACFESAQLPFRAFRVDTMFATGLATARDPTNGPDFVKSLLLRACEETAFQCNARASSGEPDELLELVIDAPVGSLPREATRRVLDAVTIDRGVAVTADGRPAPRLHLRHARYRMRATRDGDAKASEREKRNDAGLEPTTRLTRFVDGVDGSSEIARSSEKLSVSASDVPIAEARRAIAAAAKTALGADDMTYDDDHLAAALVSVAYGKSVTAFSAAAADVVAALETFRRAFARSSQNALDRGSSSADGSSSGGGSRQPVTVALIDRFPISRAEQTSEDANPKHASETRDDDSIRETREDGSAEEKNDQEKDATRRAVVLSLEALRDAIPRDGALALVVRVTQTKCAYESGAAALGVRVQTPREPRTSAADLDARKTKDTQFLQTNDTKKNKKNKNKPRASLNPFRNPFGRSSGRRTVENTDQNTDPNAAAPVSSARVPEIYLPRRAFFFPLHEFVLAAAEIGLVLDPAGCGLLVDDSRLFASMRLCRPGYRVRFARPEDVEALVAIEAANWPDEPKMRTQRRVVETRVSSNPLGNLVLTEDQTDCFPLDDRESNPPPPRAERVKGGVYFQRTASLESASAFSWHEKERARQCHAIFDDGECSSESSTQPYAQLLDIHVDQSFSRSLGRAVGNELRAFVLNVSMVTPGVEGVCAVTRTRGFRKASAKTNELTYEAYVTSASASRRDRGLFFHVGGGAVVVKPVRDWRPADFENDGKGTLIEYPLKTLLEQRWESARRGVSIEGSGEGSGSELDEPAVVVEVSFTSDAHVFTDDKE
jgi:mRNA-degrading endonuclease toxin of MazEF toxin-antitoxin module